MAKNRHPNKEIRAAIEYASAKGWGVKPASGHAWGVLQCPNNDKECRCGEFCRMSVWSTPRNPESFANRIRQKIDGCIFEKK